MLSSKISLTLDLLRCMGPKWVYFRSTHALKQRIGLFERQLPLAAWSDSKLEEHLTQRTLARPDLYMAYRRRAAPAFFFSTEDKTRFKSSLAAWHDQSRSPVRMDEGIRKGEFVYFDHAVAYAGFPPDWHLNPFTGHQVKCDQHWSRLNELGEGDIKVVWELSRFSFVFSLVRAFWRTGDIQLVELFWELIEDWQEKNPPQCGFNWRCGQEISLRVMAWCFGIYGFLDALPTTPSRVAALAQMIAVSGERIAANIQYGLSQRNNHGISEAVGLWTIGSLFPEFKLSSDWRKLGREYLEKLGRELIYDDGSFVQHSVNYHRLMLHEYLWILRLADLHCHPFTSELKERARRAGDFLYQIQDEVSGKVPYYGQNDGSLVLPLNGCDYQDFRPVIQSVHFYSYGKPCYPDGPWNEDLLWLFGPGGTGKQLNKPSARTDLSARTGGYYTIRSRTGFVFVRCATFRHRPSQADMLHVDLWWRGRNVAVDAGTYSYNSPEPWNNPLARTIYHNTLTVDGLDQMEHVTKFLWLPWLRGTVRSEQRSQRGSLAYWEGEHDGYQRLKSPVVHRRGIVQLSDYGWIVLDYVQSRRAHRNRLHWLLPSVDYHWLEKDGYLQMYFPEGTYHVRIGTFSQNSKKSLVRADPSDPRGWRAPYYYFREPAISIDLVTEEATSWLWSFFSSEPSEVLADSSALTVKGSNWSAGIQLSNFAIPKFCLVNSISLSGAQEDKLTVIE